MGLASKLWIEGLGKVLWLGPPDSSAKESGAFTPLLSCWGWGAATKRYTEGKESEEKMAVP